MDKIIRYALLIIGFLSFYTEGSFAQGITTSAGAKMVIASGTYVVVTGSLTNTGVNAAVTNDGTLIADGAMQNTTSATLQGNGSYKFGDLWNNAATFTAGTSTVELTGNTAATINSGNNPFYNLTLNKGTTSPIVALLTNAATVTNLLTFTSANNKLQLGTLNLTVGMPTVGNDATKYVITDGTGKMIATTVGATAFAFPIGSSSTSYTPLSISQSLTALSLGVRVQNQVLSLGTTGSPLSGVVNKSWVVTEESPTVGKNLTILPQWIGTDQLFGMDNAKCGVSRWNGTAWDLAYANVGARAGSDPYTRTRSGITEVGTFAVGSKTLATYVQLSAKVFLQGAYASASLMNDGLRSQSLIPAGENSSIQGGQSPRPNAFTHVAWGGGEAANQIGVFDPQVSTNDNIVDWVFVELRDPSVSSTVLHTRAALLQRDGDIVNENGTSPLKIYGVPDGNYFISIKHRNHIAVRSAATKALSQAATTVMDFTTVLTEALATSTTAYNSMATTADGKYALWGGNVNSDASTRRSGSATTSDYSLFLNYLGASSAINTDYRREDFNLDGNVRRSGSATTSDYSKFLSYLGSNAIISQPTF